MRSSCRGDAPGHCCDGGARGLARIRSWAAIDAAIAAGALSWISVSPIGQISRPMSSRREPDLAQRAHEAGALGVAADQADIGKAPRLQRRRRDVEIERMAVGHDGDEGAVGRLLEQAHRLVAGAAASRSPARGTGKAPARGSIQVTAKGKRRQRQHEMLPDMAGTEQIERRRVVAEPFDDAAVGELRIAHPGGMRSGDAVVRAVGCAGSAIVVKPPARSAAASRPTRSTIAGAEPFEGDEHAPAAALAELGAERLVEPPVRAPGPAIIDWASASASHSSAPPPMVPENRRRGAPSCARRPRAGSIPGPGRASRAPPHHAR